ncbi:MAG TPA: ABC transporter permease [Chthonomonadales bacterium]|nr:ABC transporter permease [Chthonomonadales bacterium]
MNRRVRTIALHEYLTNVRRKEFILITLGLPVLMLIFVGISALAATVAIGALHKPGLRTVGIVDPAHALDLRGFAEEGIPGLRLIARKDVDTGKREVKEGRLAALIVLDKEYLDNGRVTVYRRGGSFLNQQEGIPLGAILTRGLLARAGTDERILRRAIAPAGEGARVEVLDKTGAFVPQSGPREAARFAVPYAFTILLTTAIFISANYLLRGIAEEKENRVIEVILSSVTAEELLKGKLIGLAGVGLTQVGIWMGLGAVPAMIRFSAILHISGLTLLGVTLFFTLGFGLYATLMAGLGALGTSYRETQQTAGIVSMLAFFPFFLIIALLEAPNGTLARVLSFIPFTAPTTMVLRITATDVPWPDILLSAAAILVATWLILKLCAKLFRYGLLIYGKRPSLRETLRWLRQA